MDEYIPLAKRNKKVHKPFVITIVGAESSGKTKLATKLAEYLNCPWVPEYAREYLLLLGRSYNEADLEIIADRQLETIIAVINRETSDVNRETSNLDWQSEIGNRQSTLRAVIVDGGMMNLRMWAKIKYNKTIPIVEESLKNDVTDLYLLCRPHKKWKPDPLREAPSLIDRVWIFNKYLEELVKNGKRTEIVSARKDNKFRKVIQRIEAFLQQENNLKKTD